jgi:hypothetical protein
VVVVGSDLASMLVHVWTARSLGAGVRPWPEWIRSEARRPRLPERIDLAALAEAWVPRVGTGRVHVVLDDPRRVMRLTAGRRSVRMPRPLSVDAVELARRTASVVGTLVPPERRTALMWHRLRPVLATYPGPTLRVPRRLRPWLEEHTADLRRRLSAGGYAVHGVLPEPAERPGVTAPDEERVLMLAMQVLLGPPIGTAQAEHSAPAEHAALSERSERRREGT